VRAAHPVAQVRTAEAELMAGLPAGALMARAAAGLARRCAALLPRLYGARVVLLVGAGNNGADALWAGAALAGRGARVDALLVADADAAALAALQRAGGRVTPAGTPGDPLLGAADLVVDGLVGIGSRGALREPAARLATRVNERSALVVAVDVPSGVDADTGAVGGAAVRADVTVTFGTRKPGLLVSPGASYAGSVELVDIGLAPHLPPADVAVLDADDVAAQLPTPAPESSKYTRGVLGIVAGSDVYTGAAVLATGGALRAGAGMVRLVSVAHPAELVRARWPEAVVTVVRAGKSGSVADPQAVLGAGRVQAWVVGPGLGTDADAASVVEAVLGSDVPVVVDADGLTILSRHPDWLRRRQAPTLLTPHAGEFARLTGADADSTEQDRVGAARAAAADLGVTLLLKGTTTVVADPGGTVRVNPTGTSWLATAGSGDVLSGACGALLAGGLGPLDAGSVGAFLHGLAGRLACSGEGDEQAESPVVAQDLVEAWAQAVRAVRRRG